MKRIVWLAVLVLVAAALALGWVSMRFMDSPVNVPPGGVVYEIPPGAPFATVSRELGEMGVISQPDIYRIYARLTGRAAHVHAGEYVIEAGLTPTLLLQKFVSGDVRLHSFTIIEGWTFRVLMENLRANPAVETTLEPEDWPALLADLHADETHPEGLFLPETYRFPRHTPDREILRQAYLMMRSALQEAWSGRTEDLPLATPYQALILASIVEKETARADERAKIAGVFIRRLQKGMRLQTDPTVIYGAGTAFNGNITRADLTTDTPYNTYTRRGLPPTPIALPGRAAIEAALHPAAGPSLYFVATGLADGRHRFSDTKAEHEAAVRQYIARLREMRASGARQQ